MSLTEGTKLGPYEILSLIGAGGMGEVYKAKDTRLDRTVAIKVLPSHLAENPERRERFEREARAVSSLNHPHICTLHDIGEQDGTHYLVMEYIEGETLADRLKKGPLPLDQALRYGIEIADALDKAHRQGVVHRDLKPGNVMLTKPGAKLLDFGLAKLKASEPGQVGSELSALPTEQKPLTKEGSILGTFQYMAPEQLEGKEADARTDIFAFGSVLYEMLTGKPAFVGKSHASLIAAILEHDPSPVSEHQPLSPAPLERVVKTCLAKNPEDRWHSTHDLAQELSWIAETKWQKSVEAPVRKKYRERLAWSLLACLIALLAVGYILYEPAGSDKVQFEVYAPEGTSLFRGGQPAVSPNGRNVAFIVQTSGEQMIAVRSLDSLGVQILPGTEGASRPFRSPDSRWIGYFSVGKLHKVQASGGPAQALCDLPPGAPTGGTWNQDGIILLGMWSGELLRVSDSGGDTVVATELNGSRQEISHREPHFLPDGKHFLYFARSRDAKHSGYYVGSLRSAEAKFLVDAEEAAFVPPGYLIFLQDDALMAQPFDAASSTLSGEPFLISQVGVGRYTKSFSASKNGVLVYLQPYTAKSQLLWYDRDGRQLESVAAPEGSHNPELSPDGLRLAVDVPGPNDDQSDIWLINLARGGASRFTFNPASDANSLWSPDGSQIIFNSSRGGGSDLYRKAASGADEPQAVLQSDLTKFAYSWSLDGQHILFVSPWDIWLLSLSGDRQPVPFLNTEFREFEAQFSPNGKWISYTSNETGRYEVYVRPSPPSVGKWQISTNGGTDARWRPDGRELFFLAPDRTLMAVQVTAGTDTFQVSTPQPLFQTQASGPLGTGVRFNYAVGRNGDRFLIVSDVGESPESIGVILNWTAELEQ